MFHITIYITFINQLRPLYFLHISANKMLPSEQKKKLENSLPEMLRNFHFVRRKLIRIFKLGYLRQG